MRAALLLLGTAALGACFEDRPRPSPVEPPSEARLSVQLLAPRTGLTVMTGAEVNVAVHARDLAGAGLTGAGYVVKRFSPGRPTLDSAAVQFTARRDSAHEFQFRVPLNLPTNTQVDVYGIAFGVGARTLLTPASSLVVVNCVNGVCR